MQSAAEAYLEAQILTASAERLHLLVIDGALRFARQGKTALETGDFATANKVFARSRECVTELMTKIKTDHNPALADNLKALFVFVIRNLMLADFEHDPQKSADAIRILELHRDTWTELMLQLQEQRGPAIPTPAPRQPNFLSNDLDAVEGSVNSWVT